MKKELTTEGPHVITSLTLVDNELTTEGPRKHDELKEPKKSAEKWLDGKGGKGGKGWWNKVAKRNWQKRQRNLNN